MAMMATWENNFLNKNKTQVDLDGVEVKNRVTNGLFR